MKNKFGWILAAILLPGQALALGLGKLVVDSTLNEPFEARIELLSPTREELDSMAVGLADSEAFARSGVERLFILSSLKFELQESEDGPDSIRVYSRDSIREPFLNFLVEINWSRGRLLREYTALLDPPLYDPGIRAPAVSEAAPKSVAPVGEAGPESAPSAEAAPAVAGYTGGDYGPTQGNDTLWSIASRTRPNESVSVQEMMLALYRTNPEAFINNNINGLRRGQILRMPSEQELGALSREQALAEVQSQHSAWDPGRAAEAVAPATQVAPAAPAAPAAATAEPAAKDAELRLVAPGKGEVGAGQGATAGKGQGVDLANEQLSALTQENLDLKSRLTEAETIIEDLKRLIALKDDELAALQTKMSGAAVAPAAMPAVEPAPAPEATVEPVLAPAAEQPAPAPEAMPEPAAEPEAKPVATATPEPAAEQPPAPTQTPQRESTEKAAPKGDGGIVDTLLSLLKDNLVIIGGVIGAIVLVLGGLVFMARRKQAQAVDAEDEAAAAAVQFPDFTGSEDETILPGAGDAGATPEIEERGAAKKPEQKAEVPAVAAAPATAAAPSAPAAGAPQEDPLAEVNVFLAYEHFDQAEDFVREAIKREPDNLEFHSKLLEVFYAANDRRKYEVEARVLHDKVGGAGPHWEMALAMWQEISPNRALFTEPSGEEDAAAAPATGVGRIDLTAKEKTASADDAGLDFDLGEMTAGGSPMPLAGDEEDVLDVTAAVGLETADEAIPDPTATAATDDVLDLTGGQGMDGEQAAAASGHEDLLDVTAHADLEGAGLDADPLDVTVAAPAGTGEEEPAAVAPESGNALDFDLNLDTPADAGNMLEFESDLGKADEAGGLALDLTAGLEVPGAEAEPEADAGAGLDLDSGGGGDAGELSLEVPGGGEGGLELGLDTDTGDGAGGLELVLDEDGGGDQTVFVPRVDGTQEQSAEDEIASKLDLAKAYVELGEKDDARPILNEIAEWGTPEQRRQAQELLQQIS